MITAERLIDAGLSPTIAKTFAAPLDRACLRFGITTPTRVAMFVAQCRHESADFAALEESLSYRSVDRITAVFHRLRGRPLPQLQALVRNPRALANAAYAGVNGNGDEASGDGWAYRGSGLLGLTGRENFRLASIGCGVDYIDTPGLVRLHAEACMSAAWFWSANRCNELADRGDMDATTRVVNGPARLGATERMALYLETAPAFA